MLNLNTANHYANALQQDQQGSREALLKRVLSPSPVFTLHGNDCDERGKVEQFISEKFRTSYSAEIHEFMPQILSMRCLNSFSGAIGMRKAASSSLFLEHYLDSSIENSISTACGEPVARNEIVEIGNLVAGRKGPSQFVFLIATTVLKLAGYKWITFTATQELANNLNKLGFPMVKLADARLNCLSQEESQEWGSYYDTCPQVFVGSLDAAAAIARKRPMFRQALALYRKEIKRLVLELRGN